MGKVKWGIGTEEPEDLQGFDVYDGPEPPKGVYKVRLKFLKLKTNKNGDDMLNGLLEINEERKDKKKYNGYGIWFNQNVTEQGAPYVKQFLTALGVSWKDFISSTITDDDTDPPTIKRLGKLKLVTADGESTQPECRVLTKRGSYQGDERLEVSRFLPPKDEDEDEEDADDADSSDDSDDDEEDGEEPF